MGQAPVARA
jgi:hypothetical protein